MKALRLLALLLLFGGAAAQDGEVTLELGYGGVVVEDAWNPLRVVLRDLPAATLEVTVDQGSLRGGPVPLVYRAHLAATPGVNVFEDDLFVPAWRALTWTLRSETRTLASGSIDPRLRDDRPLVLLVSRSPSSWLGELAPLGRVQDVPAGSLPSRAAAYSGVRAIIVDGTTAAPSAEALLSATVAGAVVALVGPLPGSFDSLQLLGGEEPVQMGTGWFVAGNRSEVVSALQGLEAFPIEELAIAATAVDLPSDEPRLLRFTVALVAAGYALVVLLLLRFGGSAGFPAALVAGALVATAGWVMLRPQQPLDRHDSQLLVTSGGLSLAVSALDLRSLPGGQVTLEGPLRQQDPSPRLVTASTTVLQMARWQRELLLGKPVLTGPALEWDDGALINSSGAPMNDILVLGMGLQARVVAPGQRVVVTPREEGRLDGVYGRAAKLLPAGTALGHSGDTLYVALPEPGSEI